jgi:superfamily II RNA helicase
MEFNTYLIEKKIKPELAAKELAKLMKKKHPYSRQHIWEIRTKNATPSFKLMQIIDEWSNHVVSFEDFKR